MDDPFSCFDSCSDDSGSVDVGNNEHDRLHGTRLKEAANTRQRLASASSSPIDFTPIDNPGYEIYSCSDQDGFEVGQFGIRAKRKYHRGELIICETPVMRINTAVAAATRQEAVEKLESTVQNAFDHLSLLSAQSFMNLSSCNEAIGNKTPFGIFQTNSFSLEQDSGYGGLFITIARMNHSCNPNVNHFWRADLHSMNVYAAKDIQIGEEFCISYGPANFSSTADRREYLERKYSFQCICETCQEGNTEGGDDRMAEIRNLHENISRYMTQPKKLQDNANKCLQLMKTQGFETGKHVASMLHYCYQASMMDKEHDLAQLYLEKELKCIEDCQGKTSYQAQDLNELMKSLTVP